MNPTLRNELKGLMSFLGLLGFAYAASLVLFALVTVAKITKAIVVVCCISFMLFTAGVSPEVRLRAKRYWQSLWTK